MLMFLAKAALVLCTVVVIILVLDQIIMVPECLRKARRR